MQEIGKTPWRRERVRWPGLALAAFFMAQVLGSLSLAGFGRVTAGYPGMLKDRSHESAEGPVLYVYHVDGQVHYGWRRGITWGGEAFTVVYLPFAPAYHISSLRPSLRSPNRLFRDVDYLVRLGFYIAGTVVGVVLAVFLKRLAGLMPRNWRLLPGLDRERTG